MTDVGPWNDFRSTPTEASNEKPPWEDFAPQAAASPATVAPVSGPWQDFQGAPNPEAPEVAPPEKGGGFTNAFVRGIYGNAEAYGETLNDIADAAPESFKGPLKSASTWLKEKAKLPKDQYELASKGLFEIKGLGDAWTWAAETLGQGAASTVPPIAGGLVGVAGGGAVGGPVGAAVGGIGGAAAGGAPLNYWEMRKTLREEGVDEEKGKAAALKWTPVLTALDTVGGAAIVAQALGLGEVKREVARGIVKRMVVAAAKGAGAEGATEAAQEGVQRGVVSSETGKDLATLENLKKVVESGAGGALVGGAFGGPTGIRKDEVQVVAARPGAPLPGTPPGAPATGQEQPPAVGPPGQPVVEVVGAGAPPPSPTPADAIVSPSAMPGFQEWVEPPSGPIWFSQLDQFVQEKGPAAASKEQWEGTLKNSQVVKAEELEDRGVLNWLAQQTGKVTKLDVQRYLEENQVQLEEVQGQISRTTTPDDSGWEPYVTPGPKLGYREYLLTLPSAETRLREIENRSLQIRRGRESGTEEEFSRLAKEYREVQKKLDQEFVSSHWQRRNVIAHIRVTSRVDQTGKPLWHIEEVQSDWHQKGRRTGYTKAPQGPYSLESLSQEFAGRHTPVPDAPFKNSWVDLALKRMVRAAADQGVERISWNSGILAAEHAAGGAHVVPSKLAGLENFYDKIVPSRMRKLTSKYGGVVGKTQINVQRPSIWEAREVDFLSGPVNWEVVNERGAQHRDLDPWMTRAEAEKAVARLNEPIKEVWYVDIPPRSWPHIREHGIAMYQQPVPRPVPQASVSSGQTPRWTGEPSEDPFVLASMKAGEAIAKIAAKFGFSDRLRIRFFTNPATIPPGLLQTSYGVNTFFSSTRQHQIDINLTQFPERNVAAVVSTLAHELGHAIMWEHWGKAPQTHKQLITEAYDKWFAETIADGSMRRLLLHRDSVPSIHIQMRDMQGDFGRITAHTPQQVDYWTGFSEWFAEQVSRWATTSEEPVTIIDHVMQGIGKALRAMFEMVSKTFGLDFRPTLAMENWLNEFVGKPEISRAAWEAMEYNGRLDNQTVMDSVGPDIPAPPQQGETQTTRDTLDRIFGVGQAPPETKQNVVHADRINWWYKWLAGLDQLVDANPFFAPLLRYAERVRLMHNDEAVFQDAATRVVKDWRRLGAKQGDAVTAYFDDMTNMTYLTDDEKKRNVRRLPTPAEEQDILERNRVSGAGVRVIGKVKIMLDGFLTAVGQNAVDEAMRTLSDPAARALKLDQIRAHVENLRKAPYFPFMRFGRHFVTLRDDAGHVRDFQTFERRGLRSATAVQQAHVRELEANIPAGWMVEHGVLPEEVEPFIGLPSILLQSMREKLDLTPAQYDALEQLQLELSPGQSFRHRFQHKNFVPGYSMDFKRAFSNYFFRGAKYYARVKHAWALRDDIAAARLVGGNKAGRIADYMQDHLKNTVLDAKGDFGALKGAIFTWAMGYVPAAATQNLSQTPMITFPFLAAKFGDVRATKELVKSMTDVSNFYRRGKYDNSSDFEMAALSYGIKTGRVSETQAAELAGLSQGAGLLEGMAGTRVQRGWVQFQEKAAWMFEMAEQFNRRVAFRAALRLALANPSNRFVRQSVEKYAMEYQQLLAEHGGDATKAAAVVTAINVTEETQYVYARYARPRFMRGRTSGTLFVFKKYMQSTLWMLAHNKSDVLPRYLLIAAFIGGFSGVPGYEDLQGILRALGRWLFGKDFNIETKAREYIVAFNKTSGKGSGVPEIPPDIVIHGMARRGFGLPAVLDLMGSYYTGKPGRGLDAGPAKNVPVPVLDRSKAITLGNILPIELGKLMMPDTGDDRQNRVIAEQAQKASGAVFSVGFNIYKAIMDNSGADTRDWNDPQRLLDWKRWERAVPRALGATSKSFRAFNEERERGKGGVNSAPTIAEFNPRDTEQFGEIVAMAMGYQPLRVQAKWDSIIAKVEATKFFDMQREHLLAQAFEARKGGDKKEIEDVYTSIKRYNQELPEFARGKAISSDTIKRSLEARQRSLTAKESGTPVQKSNIGISRRIDELFPEATVDVRRVPRVSQ